MNWPGSPGEWDIGNLDSWYSRGSVAPQFPPIARPEPVRTAPRTQTARAQLTAIVFVAFALRLGAIFILHSYHIKPDLDHFNFGWETGRIARAMASGQGFSSPFLTPTGPTAWEAPLYPFLTAGVFKLFGIYSSASAFVLLTLNSLFSALTCAPIFLIARRVFSARVGRWSAWFWAVFPYTMYFSVKWIWETSLSALLLALIILLALEIERTPRLGRWALFGLLWGIAALTNTALIAFLPFCGGWIAYRLARQHRRWVAGVVLSALVFWATIGPWVLRNYEVFHKFIFIRGNFGAELRMGNGPLADGLWMWWAHPTTNLLQFREYQRLGEVAYVAERQREAVDFIRHNPSRFVGLMLRKSVYYWDDTPMGSQHWLNSLGRNGLFLASSLLAFWGLGLAIVRRRRGVFLFASLLAAYPLVYYVVFPHPRYRHPIEPELVILAAYLISETRQMKEREAAARAPLTIVSGRPTSMSIIIPVYNEAATIGHVLDTVLAANAGLNKELVIVDDYSTDGTRDLLQELERELKDSGCSVKVVFHERNQGKGAAIRTGLAHVTGDVVLVQDADLEYDPRDYERLLEPILDGHADVVFGNRFHGGPHRVLYFWHYHANRFLTFVCNLLTNLNLSDMEVGYKVFRREVISQLQLRSNRFGFEPEVTIKTAKLGCRIYEVPIAYHGRTYEEGKKIGWKDGFAALWHMIKYRFFA